MFVCTTKNKPVFRVNNVRREPVGSATETEIWMYELYSTILACENYDIDQSVEMCRIICT